jgi:hypothetical protein
LKKGRKENDMFAKEKYIMGTSIQYHITRAFKEDLGEIFRSMSNDGISEMVVNSLSGKVEELKKANVDEVTSLFLPGIKIRYKKLASFAVNPLALAMGI